MQIGIGLGLTFGGQAPFSLSSLFANGTYSGFDFSDLDPAKTWGTEGLKLAYTAYNPPSGVPVASSGDTVGAYLDKSAAVALGADVVINGSFATDTDWTKGTGWTIGGGVASADGTGATADIRETNILPAASNYWIGQYDVVSRSAGTLRQLMGAGQAGTSRSSPGTYRELIAKVPLGALGICAIQGLSNFVGSIDNVKALPVLGNHASQSTSASRPVYTVSGATKYLAFDGTDDALSDTFVPGAAMTIAVCFRAANTGATQIAVGASDASSNRSFLGVNASGALAGGWEGQSTTVITDGVSVVGTDVVGLLSANASTVELWKNGVLVYSAAASGSPNTTIALALGALNANGTLSTFLNGRIYGAVSVARADLSTSDKIALQRLLGALAGLSF